jgi:hypothetical protein
MTPAPIATDPPLQLLLIGDSDSQLLACEALARFPDRASVNITVNAIPRDGTPIDILERARALGNLWQLELAQLLRHPALLRFDAIGVFLTGSKLAYVRQVIQLMPGARKPFLFCGFNGVVLVGFEEAISWRLGYDLICLNGPRDATALKRLVADTPFADQPVLTTGLQRNPTQTALLPAEQRPRRMVFAEQVVIPASSTERQRMVRILAEVARRSPDWEVLIKPRVAPGEATFHRAGYHISQTLQDTLGHPPANLRLDYRPLPELLQEARLMATVSSTALFDALDYGCKPVVMADFGALPKSGVHVFTGSGVCRHFDSLADLDSLETELPWPDPAWLEWLGYGDTHQPLQLLNTIQRSSRLDVKTHEPFELESPGYTVNSSNVSFNQLRLSAESAIRALRYDEAAAWLELAQMLRPDHRNVKRRLRAVRTNNLLARRLRLALSPGFKA